MLQLRIYKLLLERDDINVNIRNVNGETALDIACCREESWKVANLLLDLKYAGILGLLS
jgi:hypothetical protein